MHFADAFNFRSMLISLHDIGVGQPIFRNRVESHS